MINPLITIVTPSYNQGQFIEQTIQSILNQTYSPIQYIIVDGGSNDNTMSVVEKYKDQIDIIIHEPDKGQSDAINKGFQLAKGELVGWVNSDDYLDPRCVECIVDLYQKDPQAAIYYGSTLNFVDDKGAKIQTKSIVIPNKDHLIHNDYDIIQVGSFYNTQILREVGFLDEKKHYCMDLDLWIRLLDKNIIYHFNDYPLANFRIWEESKTCSARSKFMADIIDTLKKAGARTCDSTLIKARYYSLKFLLMKLLLNR